MFTLSEQEIAALICELKPRPEELYPPKRLASRNHHQRREFPVVTESGNKFVIMLRQSEMNVLDFSAILGYQLPGFNRIFRLRRYNGKHGHINPIEGTAFYDFHIHYATERYQSFGRGKEDVYAEPTARYHSLETAINCLLNDCGFRPDSERFPLFEGKV